MSLTETTKTYLKHFLIYLEVEKNFSKHTIRAYNSDILSFLLWLDTTQIEETNHTKLKEYIIFIQRFNYTKTTLARKIAAIRTFYRFLYREKIIDVNPANSVHAPKKNKSLPKFLSNNEIENIYPNLDVMESTVGNLMLLKMATAINDIPELFSHGQRIGRMVVIDYTSGETTPADIE